MRLGGLEASMKLILEHLQIPLLKGNIAPLAIEHEESAEDNLATKQLDKEVLNVSERWQEVCTQQDSISRPVCHKSMAYKNW
jgi:hypothetical protein